MIKAQVNVRIDDCLRAKLEAVLTKDYEKFGLRKLPGGYFFFDEIRRLPDFQGLSESELRMLVHGDSQIRFSARGSKLRLKPQELNKSHDVRLSKKLAWLLRHGAETVDLTFSPGGFIFIDDILKLSQFQSYCFNDFLRVVTCDQKGRYELRDDPRTGRPEIRAVQGHSLKVDGLDLRPVTDASEIPLAVHGTYFKNWTSIKAKGLSRMARMHIHFAIGEPGDNEVISGMRRSAEILIFVDVAKAMSDGFEFFISTNKVVLCPGDKNGTLPVKYFSHVFQRRPRMRLPF